MDGIFLLWNYVCLGWEVEYTDEFEAWWSILTEEEQISVAATVQLLEERGPQLPFPHSSGINGSKHTHLRELRTQHEGRPYRTLYAFDPRRAAILLLGGDKTGDDQWYEENIPVADRLYDEHLNELKREGLIDG
ncbi:type II toxin-antitoxin system RelE/ParE family toxin [Luminiphilus syltensis]|uniref:type II toxin-antitoxin system RelE/ParE family toxin n=1 Tax=Luminiphilus syltensis TaxID=1341119 RepID=UPI002DD684B9|nr:type II toxin-antitoxin system RelE/ParE family toxin [Luminiphilus syltensis]